MWTENPVFREDLEQLAACGFIPWDDLRGKTVFITGATGLIGYTLSSALLYYSKTRGADIRVIALVRDLERARKQFSGQLADCCSLSLVQGTVEDLPKVEGPIHFIVHGASPTDSAFFVEKPVETILTAVMGTHSVLELAKEKQVSGLVYLSSMEVYGAPQTDGLIDEKFPTAVDSMSVRSSYPQAKLLCETLCASYHSEYGVPAKVARLVQTFGPGVDRRDNRIFAYAARCALNGEDIRLKTDGTKENMYLYTADAVGAILLLTIKGKSGNAYNVGNAATYCSVKELAGLAARELGGGHVLTSTAPDQTSAGIYRPWGRLKLNTEKLEKLGWSLGYVPANGVRI